MRIIAYIRTLTSRPACAAGPAAAQRTPCTHGPGAPLQRRPGPPQSSSRRTSGRRPRNSGSHTRRTALAGPGSERMGGTCAARTQSAPAISACCIAPAALPASASRRTGRSHTSGTGRRGGLSAGGCTACIRIRRRIGTFVPSSPPSPALCWFNGKAFVEKGLPPVMSRARTAPVATLHAAFAAAARNECGIGGVGAPPRIGGRLHVGHS